MGWLIGGALLICCVGVPLIFVAIQRRRKRVGSPEGANHPP